MTTMKNLMFTLLAAASLTVACGKKESGTDQTGTDSATMPVETTPQTAARQDSTAASTDEGAKAQTGFSTDGIITAYLKLQEALAKDDAKAAAHAGKALQGEFGKVDTNAIPKDKQADYADIAADAKENAEHISQNGSDIAHQREHLAVLSQDMNDLIARFGTDRKLYLDHCPMYNDGKGATWISATREIRNPYYGAAMLSCGALKKEL